MKKYLVRTIGAVLTAAMLVLPGSEAKALSSKTKKEITATNSCLYASRMSLFAQTDRYELLVSGSKPKSAEVTLTYRKQGSEDTYLATYTETYAFTKDGLLKEVSAEDAPAVEGLHTLETYTYDAKGRPTKIDWESAATKEAMSETFVYTEGDSEVTQVRSGDDEDPNDYYKDTLTYELDKYGRITGSEIGDDVIYKKNRISEYWGYAAYNILYTVDEANRIVGFTEGADYVEPSGTFEYDAGGQLTHSYVVQQNYPIVSIEKTYTY